METIHAVIAILLIISVYLFKVGSGLWWMCLMAIPFATIMYILMGDSDDD